MYVAERLVRLDGPSEETAFLHGKGCLYCLSVAIGPSRSHSTLCVLQAQASSSDAGEEFFCPGPKSGLETLQAPRIERHLSRRRWPS